MITTEGRLREVEELLRTKTDNEVCKAMHINIESLYRYKRELRRMNRQNFHPPENQTHKMNRPAKVWLLDIETLPAEIFTWRMFGELHISVEQIISSSCMLGYAVKELFKPDIYSDILTPEEAVNKDDSRIVKGLWEYFQDADVLISHNGRAFDTQYANARFIKYALPPPAPYKIIDTLYIRKNTKFDKNSLEYLCKELGLRPKIDTDGFSLWKECRYGNKEALKEMREYNEGDVLSLEDLYIRIRPWLPSHPNLGLYIDGKESRCPRCAEENTWEYVGQYATNVNLFKSYRCKNCGAMMRDRISDTPRTKKPNLMVNVNVQ